MKQLLLAEHIMKEILCSTMFAGFMLSYGTRSAGIKTVEDGVDPSGDSWQFNFPNQLRTHSRCQNSTRSVADIGKPASEMSISRRSASAEGQPTFVVRNGLLTRSCPMVGFRVRAANWTSSLTSSVWDGDGFHAEGQ